MRPGASRVLALAAGAWLLFATGQLLGRPRLLWNATASAPEGLWRIEAAPPGRGDWAAVRPPVGLAWWLSRRRYLPRGALLLKRVAAVGGQTVCRRGGVVEIDGWPVARALARDRSGRLLPVWRGCRALAADEVLLLNRARDSLDGRYFGPLPGSAVVGRARLLWRRGAP
jgi:type IV secretory pathway protease TraF